MIFATTLVLFSTIGVQRPDLVVILGIAGEKDRAVIEKDCDEWREAWSKLGVPGVDLIYCANLHSQPDFLFQVTLAKNKMQGNSGHIWIFVKGHGIIANGAPAVQLTPQERVIPQTEHHFLPVYWPDLLFILSLRPGWKGTLIADVSHNNMITPLLTPGYSAILLDRPPADTGAKVANHRFANRGERGVISEAARRSIRFWNNPEAMTSAMNEFCDSEELVKVKKNYRFRFDTFKPR